MNALEISGKKKKIIRIFWEKKTLHYKAIANAKKATLKTLSTSKINIGNNLLANYP